MLPNQQIALHLYIDDHQSGTLPVSTGYPTGKHTRSTTISNIHQQLTQLHQQLRLSFVCRRCQNYLCDLKPPRPATPPGRPTQY